MRLFHKIRWSLEQRGLAGTLTSAASSIGRKLRRPETRPPHPFDTQNSVITDGLIPGHDLAVGHANDRFIAGYAASRHRAFAVPWRDGRRAALAMPSNSTPSSTSAAAKDEPHCSPQNSVFARSSESN